MNYTVTWDWLGMVAKILLLCLVLAWISLHGQVATTNQAIQVPGTPIPGSLTSPTPAQGGALTQTVLVHQITIANTSSSAQTFTIEDCQGTPFLLANGVSIPALTTFLYPLAGTRFVGCFKWSASATSVQGSMVGSR
jgi:hypothetical protein